MKEAIQFFNKHEINDIKFMLDSPLGLDEFECLHDDLRRIVDAWELVDQFDDIGQAKAYLPEFDNDVPWNVKGGELRFFKWQLEEAITLVEEVESLREVG